MTSKKSTELEAAESMKRGDWRSALRLLQTSYDDKTSHLHWVKADENTLIHICEKFRELGISKIASIGGGSGMIEWLLCRIDATLEISGVEIDEPWWKSNYSFGPFVPTTFKPLYNECNSDIDVTNLTLLFCYFNDFEAFSKYVDWFQGKWIVIIGPTKISGRHCNPMPSDKLSLPKLITLHSTIKFESNLDEITIYYCGIHWTSNIKKDITKTS